SRPQMVIGTVTVYFFILFSFHDALCCPLRFQSHFVCAAHRLPGAADPLPAQRLHDVVYRWSLLSFWHLDLAHIITCGLERTLELVTRDVAVAVGVGLVDRRPVRSAICM